VSRQRLRRGRRGLAARLLVAQSVVLVAGALTAGLVAALVGPPIFHEHLLRAGHREASPELTHIELAYRDASLISLGVALLISLLAASAVTWFLSRRLRRPLQDLTGAATELTSGRYDARVPDVGSGTELDTLAATFNAMAYRLEGVEATRRRMLSDLAHELRTPIATLVAYHDGLRDGVTSLGPQALAVLTEQTGRLARLADDIDEVSAAEEGRLELDVRDWPVGEVVRAAVDPLRERFAQGGVALAVVDVDATVRCDRSRLAQVLTNLLTNALRHTPSGGSVDVTVATTPGGTTITVTDTGDGLSDDQLSHVFERFYRADAARSHDRSGSGIGLTISKAIVEAHGGRLAASSPGLGHGSSFVVTLPVGPR
jgi:signal transduction histidine kinase